VQKRAKPYKLALHKMAKGKKQTKMQKRATPYELGFAQNGQAMQANNSNQSAQKGSSLLNWLCTNWPGVIRKR